MFRAWNITFIPYLCSRSYIKVNVNKIICRHIQENSQKEVLSGQKMIGAIFLEILVWWNTLSVQDGHRGLVSGMLALLSDTDYCSNLMWCAICHIAVLLLGKIWTKSSLSCWYCLQQAQSSPHDSSTVPLSRGKYLFPTPTATNLLISEAVRFISFSKLKKNPV